MKNSLFRDNSIHPHPTDIPLDLTFISMISLIRLHHDKKKRKNIKTSLLDFQTKHRK